MALESIALIPSGYKATKVYSQLPVNGNGDFTFDRGTSTAQTRVNKDGLIEDVAQDVPRLDYLDGGCPSLLLEPSRTNLVQRSEEFDNSYWLKSLTSVTANQAISPDGTITADTLTKNADFGALYKSGISISSGSNYTLSIFVKKSTTNFFSLRQASGSYDVRKQFNLTTKEVTNGLGGNQTGFVSSEIKEYPNDWYKISIVCTSNGTSLTVGFYSGKVGESTNNGNTFIWGAQVEAGSYATSYIPTSGSTATRAAETCNGAGSTTEINSQEGSFYFEGRALFDSLTSRAIALGDGTANNRVFFYYTPTTNQIGVFVIVGGVIQSALFYNLVESVDYAKISYTYKANEFRLYVNGLLVSEDLSGSTWSTNTLTALGFSSDTIGGSPFYGRVKRLSVYNSALTDSQLEALTGFGSFAEMKSYLSYS